MDKLDLLHTEARAGDARAQRLLALRYLRGRDVAPDPETAVHWLGLAAAQGLALALRDLGECYERGWGVAPDPARARALYEDAAARGDPIARTRLEGRAVKGLMG